MKDELQNQKRIVAVICFIMFLFLIFFFSHVETVMQQSNCYFLESLSEVEKNIAKAPFCFEFLSFKKILFLFLLTVLIMFTICGNLEVKAKQKNKHQKGSATWNKNLKKYNKQFVSKNKEDNMILSENISLSMNTRQTMRNNNILTIGGSGAGKTRFIVKPNLLQGNCSYVITDPSGEILQSTGTFLKNEGYDLKIFNLTEMKNSHSYNPFAYIKKEEDILSMITTLIENTTPIDAAKGDPFWVDAEKALLQAICFYLHYELPLSEQNFANVSKMIELGKLDSEDSNAQTVLDILFQDLEEKDKNHIAVRQYKIFKQAACKTAMSILVSAAVRLTSFNLKAVQKITNTDTLDLENLGNKKMALFCITSTIDTTFNFLVAMLYNQIFETLYSYAEANCKDCRLENHVRFILDEFANLGTIPNFDKKLATMRKYEISCTIIIQNLAQLKTIYKNNWESITANCDTFVFLGSQEQSTLEYVSKKLGKETFTLVNYSKSKKGEVSDSFNIDSRELMTVDEVNRMKNTHLISFVRGLHPFFDKKYDYTKHDNYKKTADYDVKNIFNIKEEFKDNYIEEEVKKEDEEIVEKTQEIKTMSIKENETFVEVEDITLEENIEDDIEIEEVYNPEFEFENFEEDLNLNIF